jgi:hypothetical protein
MLLLDPHADKSLLTASAMTPLLKDIVDALKPFTHLYRNLPFLDAERFIRFAAHIKREIQLMQPPAAAGPPLMLPTYIHEFLRDILAFSDLETFQCWTALRHIIWASDRDKKESELSVVEAALFEKFGSNSLRAEERLGEYSDFSLILCQLKYPLITAAKTFYPPSFDCVQCGARLKKHSRYPVIFHSLRNGASLAYASSLYCDRASHPSLAWCLLLTRGVADCKIRHYHNYYTTNDRRFYYSRDVCGLAVPDVIQFEEHKFIEAELCELFTNLMVFASPQIVVSDAQGSPQARRR